MGNEQNQFWDMTMWTVIFIAGSCYVVANGIDAGIDKAMRFLLPMLFYFSFSYGCLWSISR